MLKYKLYFNVRFNFVIYVLQRYLLESDLMLPSAINQTNYKIYPILLIYTKF